MLLAAVLALVVTGSPARVAVTDLVTGSQAGVVPAPVLPLFVAGGVAAAAVAAACALTTRRG
jgi:hypothetical protein